MLSPAAAAFCKLGRRLQQPHTSLARGHAGMLQTCSQAGAGGQVRAPLAAPAPSKPNCHWEHPAGPCAHTQNIARSSREHPPLTQPHPSTCPPHAVRSPASPSQMRPFK